MLTGDYVGHCLFVIVFVVAVLIIAEMRERQRREMIRCVLGDHETDDDGFCERCGLWDDI